MMRKARDNNRCEYYLQKNSLFLRLLTLFLFMGVMTSLTAEPNTLLMMQLFELLSALSAHHVTQELSFIQFVPRRTPTSARRLVRLNAHLSGAYDNLERERLIVSFSTAFVYSSSISMYLLPHNNQTS